LYSENILAMHGLMNVKATTFFSSGNVGRPCCWAFTQIGYACRSSCSGRYFWSIVTKTGIAAQFPVKYCNFKFL
jgi:hypothetical protein